MKRAVLLTVENHLRQYRRLQRRQDREARLLVLRYFDGLTEESVMDFINASRNTYYAWKKDVLDTVAFHAAQKGLL